MFRRGFTTISKKINDFSKHNVYFIDTVDITIHHPDTVSKSSLYREHMYKATVKYTENGEKMYKVFEDDNFDTMYNKMQNFIHNERKP